MRDEFSDDAEDEGLNDYAEVLKSAIGGLNLLIDTLMGNTVDGVETTPEEQRQAWEDGKEAGRQKVIGPNPYRTTTEGRYLLAQLWLAGWSGVRNGHLS